MAGTSNVPRLALLAAAVVAAAGAAPVAAAESIAWARDLPAAIAEGKSLKKVVMVCVNARFVEGRTEEEPAAKGLREVVYRDPRVVQRSRDFACAMITPEDGADAYAPLRALGIEGVITSPQHIFLSPAGDRILLRRAYWPHGKGDPAVKALLALMDEAAAAAAAPAAAAVAPDAPAPPPDSPARAAWIAAQVEKVKAGGPPRYPAAEALMKADAMGDCAGPLLALLANPAAETDLLVCVIRALGRDGLEPAALPVAGFLEHKDPLVRGNAAVTLEYIGSHDEKVIQALSRHAQKEKDEVLANHAWRALGRCGAKNAKVGALLLAEASGAASEFASYGPCFGLAYFREDRRVARGVEKLLKQIGVPGGRRGGGGDTVKRGVVSWVLANVGDADSAKFVEEELLSGLKNTQAFWVAGLRKFWEDTAAACRGREGALADVENGVRGIVGFARGGEMGRYGAETRSLTDACRKGREAAGFKPKGEGLLDLDGQ